MVLYYWFLLVVLPIYYCRSPDQYGRYGKCKTDTDWALAQLGEGAGHVVAWVTVNIDAA